MGRLALMVIVLVWLGWTIYSTHQYLHFKRLVEGLHEPELWLPRRERRAHARKLLRREDDEYIQQLTEKIMRGN